MTRESGAVRVHRDLAREWASVSPEQKAEYEAKASEMQRERDALQAEALNGATPASEAAGLQINEAQVKRMNNARLDRSLQVFATHPCWRKGLPLADHVCALKASLMLAAEDVDKVQWREWKIEHQQVFGYDPSVISNPDPLPRFQRPCYVPNGGLCKEEANFELIKSLVMEFDSQIQKNKMGSEPFLARLEVNGAAASNERQQHAWVVVAGVCRRPVCHTTIHLE